MAETIVRNLKVNRRYSTSPCAWCGDGLSIGDNGAICEACESPHHARCWQEHGGCGASGCVSNPLPNSAMYRRSGKAFSRYLRLFSSSFFYLPIAGLSGAFFAWLILGRNLESEDARFTWLTLPLLGLLIVVFILISDGIASRRLRGNLGRWFGGVLLTLVFTFLAQIVIGVLFTTLFLIIDVPRPDIVMQIRAWPVSVFVALIVWRSLAWSIYGAAVGLGMNLMRSTSGQRRASVVGGVIGGAISGLLMDCLNRFIASDLDSGNLLRLVMFSIFGLSMGIFVALGEHLSREAWIRVRTGALSGQLFVLFRTSTVLGSSPQAAIFLIKDRWIAPTHAVIYRVGEKYELEALDSEHRTEVNGGVRKRYRLSTGDRIIIGKTILDFEQRAKRPVLKKISVAES